MNEYRTNESLILREEIAALWPQLQKLSQDQVTDAYVRLLCIETNELEDVFRLGGSSLRRLV